jgi:hypothetical protein
MDSAPIESASPNIMSERDSIRGLGLDCSIFWDNFEPRLVFIRVNVRRPCWGKSQRKSRKDIAAMLCVFCELCGVPFLAFSPYGVNKASVFRKNKFL